MQEPNAPQYALLVVATPRRKVDCRLVLDWIQRRKVIGMGHNQPPVN